MSDYMNDDDRVQVLRQWWQENGTTLLVTLVVVVAGVIGWRWYTDYTEKREEAASTTYQQYLEARHRDAMPEQLAVPLATLDHDFSGSSYRIFTLFYRAHDAANAKQPKKAMEYLTTAIEAAKDDRLRDIARLRLARLQTQTGNTDVALETLRKVSGEGFRAYVAELKGDILLGEHKPDAALEAYRAAAAATDPADPHPVLDMKIVDLTKPHAPAP